MSDPVAVPWSPEALTRWRAAPGDTVDAAEHDAAGIAFGCYADVLAAPARFEAAYRAGGATWPVTREGRSLVGESLSPEGITASAEALRAARASGDRSTVERLQWRLAMVNAVEDLGDSVLADGERVRSAGIAPLTAVVVVAGILGAAVVAREISLAIREPAAARLRALELAGEAAARRYARAAGGAPLEPETPVETAVRDDVRQRADSELEKAARGATGLVIAGALAVGLYLLLKSQAAKRG